MKLAVVTSPQLMCTQWSLWKIEKELLEAERLLVVRQQAVEAQARKVERLRTEIHNRKEKLNG
jgi:hypothetical protein